MKKVTDSFIFQQLLKNENVASSIKAIVPSKNKVDEKAIEEQLRVIDKRMKYAGKDVVMELYQEGIINVIYNPSIKIPKYLNTFLKPEGNKIVALSDITNFARISKEGNADITAKTLFTLMQNAAINYELFSHWNKYTTNVNMVKNGAIVYAKMLGKVIDKLYAIKIDNLRSDLIHFLLAKFFIINMCDRVATTTVDEIAYHAIPNKTSLALLQAEAEQIPEDAYENLEKFIKALSTLNMKNLNIRIVIENYARMYGEASLLSLDYLPAFFAVIFGVAIQGAIYKDYVIESLCGKQIESLYVEFFKIAR